MTGFTIENQKEFMNLLLRTDAFDRFLITEAEIRTNALFQINCRLSKGFYESEELSALKLSEGDPLPYSMMRETLFDLIKGKHLPISLKLVLSLSEEDTGKLILSSGTPMRSGDLSGLFLNLSYLGGVLRITTGIGYRIFSKDRSLEASWDAFIGQFLTSHGILFTEIG